MTVVTDWLDVTFASGAAAVGSARSLASELCSEVAYSDECAALYRFDHEAESGTVRVDEHKTWCRVSASGAALARIRALGMFGEWLGVLSDSPHNVTRLDAAYDVLTDNPGKVIRQHYRRYRDGVSFGRKAVPTTATFSPGIDGQDTGTVYHGQRAKSQVSGRVYDKGHQMLERYGAVISPRVRYELTVRREVGATLGDAYSPAPLFWHFAHGFSLKPPAGVAEWVPHSEGVYFPRRPEVTPFARAQFCVDRLPLDDLARHLQGAGESALPLIMQRLQGRLERLISREVACEP